MTTGIAAFEQQHGIVLRDDYRQFLLLAGDGGAGRRRGSRGPPFLASPCPLLYDTATRPDWASLLPRNWRQWGRGSISLCDQGCTYVARLVVTGAARGRVVYLEVQKPSQPYFVKDRNFIDWYERWLDQVITGIEPFWFGYDNPDYGPGPKP